jgi:hypothetical protein
MDYLDLHYFFRFIFNTFFLCYHFSQVILGLDHHHQTWWVLPKFSSVICALGQACLATIRNSFAVDGCIIKPVDVLVMEHERSARVPFALHYC